MKSLVLMLGAACAVAGLAAQAADLPFAKERQAWNVTHKPFRLIGNIYYVGMAGVSAFLIVTPQGDILTDGALLESAPFIEKNIRALGFKLSDVKILLNSHAHFDHSGGLAQLKKDTGAKLYAGAPDKPVLESGHIAYGPAAQVDAPKVMVDHAVKDGETLSLGGVTLTAHATPGHTQGCTTWTYAMPPSVFADPRASYDHLPRKAGDPLNVMFFCSISVAGNPIGGSPAYPDIASDYRASFARLDKMQADVFLAPHGNQFGLDDKLSRMKPGAPNPFVDPGELHRFLAQARSDFDTALAKAKTP
jgi:metallo-beta-lactamase class B